MAVTWGARCTAESSAVADIRNALVGILSFVRCLFYCKTGWTVTTSFKSDGLKLFKFYD